MTSASVPVPVHGHDEGGLNLAQDTGGPRAGLDADLTQGTGGGLRVHGEGGPIQETGAVAVDQGIEGKRKSQKSDRKHPQKATAALGDPEVLTGDTDAALALLARPGRGPPDLHLHDATKKRKRRTRIAKRNGRERRTGTGAEM